MPAVSKAQQRFMGMVHAAQKGDMENPSPEVAKVADTMKKVDAKDFASTKHKGLPAHIKERLKEIIRGVMKAEGAFGSVIGGPEDGRNLNEMSPKDIHFKAILAMYDKGGSFTKKKVAVAVSNNPNASRNKIVDDLKDLDYHEILDAQDQLGIDETIVESVINEDTRRVKLLGIDFKVSEMNGRIFFSFVDKKAASVSLRQVGTNKIVNHIQNRLDIAYGKGTFFFKSGDHAEFQNGYLFQRNTPDINLNKLKFESVNEEHDCGCNENHDCGCGGVHEHTHIHEDLSADANGIAGLTASRATAVKDFLEKNNINSNKLYLFLKKGNLKDRMDFVTALVGKPGNPIQKKVIKQFSN